MIFTNLLLRRNLMLRTCAAFAGTTTLQSFPAQSGSMSTMMVMMFSSGTALRPSSISTTAAATTTQISSSSRLFSTNDNSSSSNSFQPPSPPGTHGTPVFEDVDFSIVSPDATQRNLDPNAVFVVTGASRGIGLQFVKTLTTKTKGKIVACCRTPEQATQLNDFLASLSAEDASRIEVLPLDLQDQSTIEAFGTRMRDAYSRVDVLLNVAGLLGDAKTTPGPERTITKMDREWFETGLAINLVGPVMVTKELVPLLAQPKARRQRSQKDGENDNQTPSRPAAVVANLSARVGSISDNGIGGWYSYRISKAGLNQATRTMALELGRQSVWCIALHPGTTNTDLSKPFQANVKKESLFPVDFTVNQLLSVIDSAHAKHSGGLYDWAGKAISF